MWSIHTYRRKTKSITLSVNSNMCILTDDQGSWTNMDTGKQQLLQSENYYMAKGKSMVEKPYLYQIMYSKSCLLKHVHVATKVDTN